MTRKIGLIITLMLLVCSPTLFADEEATEGALLSTAMLSESLPLRPAHEIVNQPVATVPKKLTSLGDAILLYEAIQHSERWQFFADGPLLAKGDRHAQVSQLKGQLRLLGDLPRQSVFSLASQHFDESLQTALMHFQMRHSVKADGILGPQTRALLNVPPWQRIDQLVLNINRQRQLLLPSEEFYLQVNIPESRLRLYARGNVLLDMKTIIGRRTRQTPVFSAEVKSLVVNPDWNVPKSIAFKDILPHWEEDNGYLTTHNLYVLSGWETPVLVPEEEIDLSKMYRGANYQRLWEPPGENNTLGRIKFPLTSDNSIYLHDTNNHHLFELDRRAFSSGCIRLESARSLADALIQEVNYWEPELLDPLFESIDTYIVKLQKPVPLYVTYWTAWIDEQGTLNFANDLYHRDMTDLAALQNENPKVGRQRD